MLSYSRPIERCRPLLGTFVRIRVHGLAPECAHAAIDRAFEEISQIHQLMSFHEPQSDVSRLNRDAHVQPISVDRRTHEVLTRATEISNLSEGAFDISIAPALVARGLLPVTPGAPEPHKSANWSDIVLLDNCQVQFAKPLWIDLGGIAKGYAVDRAVGVLESFSPAAVCVNAGGDLRLTGKERVRLMPDYRCGTAAIVDIECGSLASSCGEIAPFSQPKSLSPHVCTQRHGSRDFRQQFVCVVASRCMDADALTKVVMAAPSGSAPILDRYSAHALTHDAKSGWRDIERAGLMGIEALLHRSPVRLPTSRRLVVYCVGFGVWCTGALWLFFHYLLQRQTEFGEQPHPLEFWWRAAHGFFGFASVWTFGLIWGAHVVAGWKSGRRRVSGIILFAILVFLTATGYLLYYLGGDELIATVSLMHWTTGVVLPIAFFAHRFLFVQPPRRSGKYP